VIDVRLLHYEEARRRVSELAAVLADCVAGGASVNFMAGFSQAGAEAFFSRVADGVGAGDRALFAAFLDGALAGTAQLVPAPQPNQPHRADIAKMLVARAGRRRGLGRALLAACEAEARAQGRTLLTLDTMVGGEGDKLYRSMGYQPFGIVPGFALYPDGAIGDTVFFWKAL
jgi:GNAT superfamily N-acetyltransferase